MMNFKQALEMMKKGKKVKLPSWGGYWYWDPEKETIIMHTKEGKELDIRETDRVDYTLTNVLSDEWQIADKQNCPELGGEATFNFGEAIKYLKRGMKVARKGWNGKGMYLFLADEIHFLTKANLNKPEGKSYETCSSIVMKTADNKCVVGWIASQTDMLAEDWVFVE